MAKGKPTTWGDIYWKYRRKGEDHGACAYEADRWQETQDRKARRAAKEDTQCRPV